MSSTLREVHKFWYCVYHYFVTKKKIHSGDAQLSVVIVYISLPQGWEFDSKWRPKGVEIDIWKPENVKFPVGCPPPILGQTIDRCIKLILSCVTLTVFLGHHTSLGKMLAITHVNEVQMQKLTWQYLNPLNESALI